MKALKNPAIAILLAIIVVIASSLISIDIKLSSKAEEVSECFQQSYRYHGKSYSGIEPGISEMESIADDIVIIADNYGIKTSGLKNSLSMLRSDLNQLKLVGVNTIYKDYAEFDNELKIVEAALESTDLSERHSEAYVEYSVQLDNLREQIKNDAYNELAANFLKKCDKFPAKNFASMLSIPYPQAFE